MPAPKGNTYYKLAKNFKKPKKYQPEELWNKALEYAEWVEKNPLYEEKVFGTGKRMKVAKIRAMSQEGFQLYANICHDTWYRYEKDKAYSTIIKKIKAIFYAQKFEGASAELLNASIIARDLGLKEQQDITTNNEPITGMIIK